jgi:uncharacterized integral membrane protein
MKHWAIAIVVILCLILVIQNAQVVSLNIFFWKISMSGIVAFPMLVIVGLVIGYVHGRYKRHGIGRR